MGLIPATGTAIAMGRVAQAYGLGFGSLPGSATNASATALNGVGSTKPIKLGAQLSKTSGQQTKLSFDFGGRTTPNNY